MTERTPERMAALVTGLGLLAAAVCTLLAKKTGLMVLPSLLPFCFLTTALGLLAFGRLRLLRLAEEERRDEAIAQVERPDAALFRSDESAAQPFTLERTREQFERYFLPFVPLILALAQGLWAWRLFRALPRMLTVPTERLLASAFTAGLAFVAFVLCRYLLALARSPALRALRAPGLGLGGLCAASILSSLSAAAAELIHTRADYFAANFLTGVLAVFAVESLLLFLVTLYSPRRTRDFGAACESRLTALLMDPAGWTRSVVQAVDYQFGVNVAQASLMRLVRNALGPLILLQLITLYLMSSFVFLGPEEEAVLERWGKPKAVGGDLASGFHFKWPWPVETLRRAPARRILSVSVGFEPEGQKKSSVIVWTIPHFRQEDVFLVPGDKARAEKESNRAPVPLGLISVNIPIEYRVTNLHAYVYDVLDPARTLRQAAYQVLTRALAHRELTSLLGPDRITLSRTLREDVQRRADELGLGVEVLFVGLHAVHPPVQVADAFESVVGAIEEKEASIHMARAYAASELPRAEADAETARRVAEAYRVRRTETAEAEADHFEKRREADLKSPVVFRTFLYLATLRDTLSPIRKYIVDHRNAKEILYFNFEEKPYPELFDMGVSPETEGASKP